MSLLRWLCRNKLLHCLLRVLQPTVAHRWRRKLCPDNHTWLKITLAFCLFTTSACVLIGVITQSTEPPIDYSALPLQNTPNDKMQGLALRPEIRAQPGDNYKIWPFEVTNLNYNWEIIPKNPCQGDTFLVLFVHTRPHFLHSRKAIRETWGSAARTRHWPGSEVTLPKVEIYFVTARSQSMPSMYETLQAENDRYNDIIMFDFADTYFNVTLKSTLELRWFTKFCPHAKYAAKADDDVFIDIKHLVEFLQTEEYKTNTIIGDLISNPRIYRDHPKWAVPYHRFSERRYPDYMKGTTYIITSDLPDKIVSLAPFVLPIHIDDVFITGILAKILNVDLVKSRYFKVLEKVPPNPCLVHYLRKIVTLGTANPMHIKHLEEKESQMFQYVIWQELNTGSSTWHCSIGGLYWLFCDIF